MRFSFLSVLFCCILFVVACSDPKPKIVSADLVGDWTLTKAERDSKETATLVGLTFQFKQDDFIRLNLPHPDLDAEKDYKYEIQDNKLSILNADLSFDLIELTEDQLVMKANLQENEFTFWLSK